MLRVGSRESKHDQTEAASEQIDKKLRAGLLAVLPDELIGEILSWLPPEFVGRCKIVCKLWREIIESGYFIEQHLQRQEYIMVNHDLPPEQQPLIALFHVRGLLLEQNIIEGTYQIRNYATAQVFPLPDLRAPRIYSSMCYRPTSDEYIVLNFHWKDNHTNIGLEVLTVGTDIAWRYVEIPSQLSCYNRNEYENVYAGTIGSVIYITKLAGKFSKTGSQMMAFQTEDESVVEISLPRKVQFCAIGPPFVPMRWDSHMSFARIVGKELHGWVLQDYKTSKWDIRKIFFSPIMVRYYPSFLEFTPEGFFRGEILVLTHPQSTKTNKMLVRYNIKTQHFDVIPRRGYRIKPSLVAL